MTNYKLYIKDSNHNWQLLDIGNEKPAMNYQVNDIAELKDRQCDYSQVLKLPITPGNCEKFGFANIPDVDTNIPYRKHECRLFCGESIIAGKGSYLILDRISNTFETQILSGNVDLFELLSNKQMSELDLGFVQFGMEPFGEQTTDWVIPRLNLIKDEKNWNESEQELAIPFAWLKNSIEKILTGYEFVTNIADDDWNKKAINIVSLNPSEDSFIPFECEFKNDSISVSHDNFDGVLSEEIIPTIINSGNGSLVENAIYTAKSDMQVRIEGSVNISFSGQGDGYYTFKIEKINENEEYEDIIRENITIINSNIFTYNKIVELKKGEKIIWTLTTSFTPTDPYEYWWEMTGSWLNEMTECKPIESTSQVPIGGNLYIAQNLGFDTQLDYFKNFVQLFGLTVWVDNDNKKVFAYTMKELYDNKTFAKNWSKKLHNPKGVPVSFSGKYAKKNIIKFTEYDTLKDEGNFQIDNDSLESSKELFVLKYEAGRNYKQPFVTAPLTVAEIPFWIKEIDEDSNITYNFQGAKPHICEIKTAITTIYATQTSVQDFINSHYTFIVTMLDQFKSMELEFNLTEQDIEEYININDNKPGVFIPVGIDYFGAYFYINKIKNFVSGKLTKCELVRL